MPSTPYNRGLAAIQQEISAKKRTHLIAAPRWVTLSDHENIVEVQDLTSPDSLGALQSGPTDQAAVTEQISKHDTPCDQAVEGIDELEEDEDNVPVCDEPKKKSALTSLEAQLIPLKRDGKTKGSLSKKQKLASRNTKTGRSGKSLRDILDHTEQEESNHINGLSASSATVAPKSMPGFLQLREQQGFASAQVPMVETSKPTVCNKPVLVQEPPWMSNPALRNPAWYDHSLSIQQRPIEATAAIASIRLCQERPLVRNLQRLGFDLIERETAIQGTDLVISTTTAILFRQLRPLPNGFETLVQELKLATYYYHRVMVVFEVIAYSVKEKATDAETPSVDPLGPPVLQALSALRRRLAVLVTPGANGTIGTVDLLFALNGAAEVIRVLRALLEDELEQVRRTNTALQVMDICEDRRWLWRDVVRLLLS